MKKQLIAMGTAMILLSGGGAAQAALIDGAGSGFNWTTDTQSSLDWLDLSHTLNMTYNYVTGNMDAGETFHGWRYASMAEITTFWNHITGDTFYGVQGSQSSYENWTDEVAAYVGYTLQDAYVNSTDTVMYSEVRGMSGEMDGDSVVSSLLRDYTNLGTSGWYYQNYNDTDAVYTNLPVAQNYVSSGIASYLVRNTNYTDSGSDPDPVPEPATMLLMGSGVAGLVAARRRKKQT